MPTSYRTECPRRREPVQPMVIGMKIRDNMVTTGDADAATKPIVAHCYCYCCTLSLYTYLLYWHSCSVARRQIGLFIFATFCC